MPNPVLSPQRWDHETEQAGWAAPRTGAAGMAGGFGARTAQRGADAAAPGAARMTIGGTMVATAVLFVLLLATAAIGWGQVTQTETEFIDSQGVTQTTISTDFPSWVWLPMIAGLILGFVTAFKPKLARITAPLFALGYGFAIGAISHLYDLQWDGIVLQAVGATLAVFAVMLFLYATRIIKVTKKYVVMVVAATGGIFVLYMVTWIASLFGADITFWNEPSPLGIGISIVIVIVAALNLGIDFAFIEQASDQGAPKSMEWVGAFGLTVTLIWLYLEILRLLSLLRQ